MLSQNNSMINSEGNFIKKYFKRMKNEFASLKNHIIKVHNKHINEYTFITKTILDEH
jgi:hypothetical protein